VAAHDVKKSGKKYPTQHFYSVDLRTHALRQLTLADTSGIRKREYDTRALIGESCWILESDREFPFPMFFYSFKIMVVKPCGDYWVYYFLDHQASVACLDAAAQFRSDISGAGFGFFIILFYACFFYFSVDYYPYFIHLFVKVGSVTGELVT